MTNTLLIWVSVIYGLISLFYFYSSYVALETIEKQFEEKFDEQLSAQEIFPISFMVALMSILWPIQIVTRGVIFFKEDEDV